MSYDTPDHNMEMPTHCQKCNKWFDLNDGTPSEKWLPNTVICDECGKKEEREMDLEQQIEDYKSIIADAEWTIQDATPKLKELVKELSELQNQSQ